MPIPFLVAAGVGAVIGAVVGNTKGKNDAKNDAKEMAEIMQKEETYNSRSLKKCHDNKT